MHQRSRTLISVVGTAFSVVLMFMQLGFLGAVDQTASLLYDKLQFDLILVADDYSDLSKPGSVDRTQLSRAAGVPGVVAVQPFSIGNAAWQNPDSVKDDPTRGMFRWQLSVVGVDPGRFDSIFQPPGARGLFATAEEQSQKRARLSQLDTVLLDERSRPDFGDIEQMREGDTTSLNGQRVTFGGTFRAGTGFSYTGLLLTNEQTFQKYLRTSPRRCTCGLIQLEPGASTDAVKAGLQQLFEISHDKKQTPTAQRVQVFTRAELIRLERDYWVSGTSLGVFFTFGSVLAISVGMIFIYQMMVADIKKNLPEYATLKAMGYPFGFLFRVVVCQGLFLALGGFLLGAAAALPTYTLTAGLARLPMTMTAERLLLVSALTVGMCVVSAMLAVQKVRTADPADLF